MKKTICVIAAFVIALSLCVLPSTASSSLLADDLGLLSAEEKSSVENRLAEVSGNVGADVVIVTTDDLDGKSTKAYADDFYDYNGYSRDGVLLLVYINGNDRRMWISTSGYGITAFTDYGIDCALDRIIDKYYDFGWKQALTEFADISNDYFTRAHSGNAFDVRSGGDPFNVIEALFISLVCGLIISVIIVSVMKGRLRSVRLQNSARNYTRPDSMILTQRSDVFLYKNTTKTYSPRSESSGGSSTHTSSSGSSHGGGGRSF